jgi:hypothetical protein
VITWEDVQNAHAEAKREGTYEAWQRYYAAANAYFFAEDTARRKEATTR